MVITIRPTPIFYMEISTGEFSAPGPCKDFYT
jgi:hypothetical protein